MSAARSDGSILRALGLMLSKDEHNVQRPTSNVQCATPILWRRCGWCHSVLGVIAVEHPTPGMFSDSICPACRTKFFATAERQEVAA